ncbi:MAG: hypothetical protein EB149_03010 [Thaumarchaeota archaeon]|nr:hypothetical protein [Nitrososphaerota archaeon]
MKAILLLALMIFATGITPVFAHKTITVDQYNIEVGWKDEPPLVGQQNAITFEFSTDEGNGVSSAVTNAFKDLTATINSGSVSKQLDVLSDEKPGSYHAKIIPTQTGPLTISLQGTLNGIQVNEQTEVEDVDNINVIAFPPTDASGSSDIAKIKNSLGQLQQDVSQISQVGSANSGKSDYAVLALGIGAAGVILAVISLVKRK